MLAHVSDHLPTINSPTYSLTYSHLLACLLAYVRTRGRFRVDKPELTLKRKWRW